MEKHSERPRGSRRAEPPHPSGRLGGTVGRCHGPIRSQGRGGGHHRAWKGDGSRRPRFRRAFERRGRRRGANLRRPVPQPAQRDRVRTRGCLQAGGRQPLQRTGPLLSPVHRSARSGQSHGGVVLTRHRRQGGGDHVHPRPRESPQPRGADHCDPGAGAGHSQRAHAGGPVQRVPGPPPRDHGEQDRPQGRDRRAGRPGRPAAHAARPGGGRRAEPPVRGDSGARSLGRSNRGTFQGPPGRGVGPRQGGQPLDTPIQAAGSRGSVQALQDPYQGRTSPRGGTHGLSGQGVRKGLYRADAPRPRPRAERRRRLHAQGVPRDRKNPAPHLRRRRGIRQHSRARRRPPPGIQGAVRFRDAGRPRTNQQG